MQNGRSHAAPVFFSAYTNHLNLPFLPSFKLINGDETEIKLPANKQNKNLIDIFVFFFMPFTIGLATFASAYDVCKILTYDKNKNKKTTTTTVKSNEM